MKLNLKINLLLTAVALTIMSCAEKKPALLLPVYGEKKVDGNRDTIYHTIEPFSFVNQYGEKVTEQTVKNHIYVANFFFATCQSICPEMSTNLTTVQKEFEQDSILILSHSVNPMHDTVEVLAGYAATYGAKKNKWHLLTGDKKAIYSLAKNSYLVSALEDDGTPEGFLHSELLLLVDTHGRIRGMFDGTDKVEVNKLIEAIKTLKKERNS
jgi:protein SCO1/2